MDDKYVAMFAKHKALVQSLDEDEVCFLYLRLQDRVLHDEFADRIARHDVYYEKMFGVDAAHPVTDDELDEIVSEYKFQLDDDTYGILLDRLQCQCIQKVLEERIFHRYSH